VVVTGSGACQVLVVGSGGGGAGWGADCERRMRRGRRVSSEGWTGEPWRRTRSRLLRCLVRELPRAGDCEKKGERSGAKTPTRRKMEGGLTDSRSVVREEREEILRKVQSGVGAAGAGVFDACSSSLAVRVDPDLATAPAGVHHRVCDSDD
jgi:hypothetical protein